jgi:chromosome partitioning protein
MPDLSGAWAAVILALVNNKGGVGKTTTAVNLAAALAGRDRRVLLVDLDSQASASHALGVARADLAPSAADALLYGMPVRKAIRTSAVPSLDLLTGSRQLANADLVLSNVERRETCLAAMLDAVPADYGCVVIDCAPGLSLLVVNALVAAHALVIPVTPQYLAVEGLVNLLDAIEQSRRRLGVRAPVLGIALTMVDARARAARELVALVRAQYGALVFQNEVPLDVRLAEAPSFGRTIFEYAPACAGATAYARLADEVLRRAATQVPSPN